MANQLIIPTAEPFLLNAGKTGCVLVHGFTGAPKEMRLMGEALYRYEITTLGIRLAGHATQPTDLNRTHWQDWLASVEDGIHILSDICDKVFIAGLSLGGILALVAASRYEQLKGAIAIATPYNLGSDWRLKFARQLSMLIPQIEKKGSESHDPTTARAHVDYPTYPTKGIAELQALTEVLHQSLPIIRIPILLINSRADHTVPIWHADKIQQELNAADVDRLIVEESDHVITEDIGREKVFETAFQFIKRHGG
ncbi:MAG: alpha/beta fold hydrolase [Chloroflexi bacterium]|nr:alpha/beta fold hydrolase [Chloroflexota bacterium]